MANEQDFDLMAAIQAEFPNLASSPKPTAHRSTAFYDLNTLLRRSQFPLAVAICEISPREFPVKPAMRLGFGLLKHGDEVGVDRNHLVIPVNPHLYWQDAISQPANWEMVDGNFVVNKRGSRVLEARIPLRDYHTRQPFSVERRSKMHRLSLFFGQDAYQFMDEASESLAISAKPIRSHQTELARSFS